MSDMINQVINYLIDDNFNIISNNNGFSVNVEINKYTVTSFSIFLLSNKSSSFSSWGEFSYSIIFPKTYMGLKALALGKIIIAKYFYKNSKKELYLDHGLDYTLSN